MTSAPTLTLECPAKVNLALSVGTPLPSGLHPIGSWMVALDLADRLSLSKAKAEPSRYEISFAPQAPAGGVVDWPLERDLSVRAHRLLEQHTRRPLPLRLVLQKMIPCGAGLGGGSSDAAGTLVGVNRLWNLGLTEAELQSLAGQLGSDVAFLVAAIGGHHSAVVSGLGETMEYPPEPEDLFLTLIFPGFACPTGAVYQAWDRLHGKEGMTQIKRVRLLAQTQPLDPASLFNDLAQPACMVASKLKPIMRDVATYAPGPVHMTGSGSTLFVVCPAMVEAQCLAGQIREKLGLASLAAAGRRGIGT